MLSPIKVFTMRNAAIFGIIAGALVIFVTFSSWPRTSKFSASRWKGGTSVSKGAIFHHLPSRHSITSNRGLESVPRQTVANLADVVIISVMGV